VSEVPRIVVVGLGPADVDLLASVVLDAIDRIPMQFLRTRRHPAARALPAARSFDDVYESARSIDDVYPAIVEQLVAAASEHGEALYAVPGSPVVAETTVSLLVSDPRVAVTVLPALSFLDLAWVRLGIDPVATSVRIVDGHRFEVDAAGQRGPLFVAQCDSDLVLADIVSALADAVERIPNPAPRDLVVTVVQRLGLPDESIVAVPWHELARITPDHLTSLWIPELAAPIAGTVEQFAQLVATLRIECPWDAEQTHESLRRHLLEESYEVLEALDVVDPATGEGYDELEEELGDLLFQILFHATLAAEAGQFTMADVATTVHDKLRSRHPHVFGSGVAGSADEVAADWEQQKKTEKGRASVFDGVPAALPALLFALKVQKKAATLATSGDVVDLPATPDLAAALGGLTGDDVSSDAVGDVLLAVVDVARRAGIDPEMALRARASAWRDAVRQVEAST